MASDQDNTLLYARRLGRVINSVYRVSPSLAGLAAFRAFCTPQCQPLRDRDRDFLATARQRTLTIARASIRVYEWGNGDRNVLYVHGWQSNSARWRSAIDAALQAGFRCFALDAPAHGQSGGKMLNLLLYSQTLNEVRAQLPPLHAAVGHSIGGAALTLSMADSGLPVPSRAVVMASFAESSRVLDDFGKVLSLRPGVVALVDREIWRRTGMSIHEYSIVERLRRLRHVPGLVIHDLLDDLAPVEEGRLLAEAWGARYLETKGLGHRLQGTEVVQAVTGFLLEGN